MAKQHIFNYTRALQPVATCCQLPYLHKPAIIINDVILIMTSFATELTTPSIMDERTDTLLRLSG